MIYAIAIIVFVVIINNKIPAFTTPHNPPNNPFKVPITGILSTTLVNIYTYLNKSLTAANKTKNAIIDIIPH